MNFIKFWEYGTNSPVQRIGLIILIIGISSFLGWCFKAEIVFYSSLYSGWLEYVKPTNNDNFFYHLHIFSLPFGLLLTWGYGLLIKLKQWIIGENKKENSTSEILYFKDNDSAWEIAKKYFPTESDDKLIAEEKYLARLLEDYNGLSHNGDEIAISTTNEKSFCIALLPKDHQKKYPKGTLIFYTPVHLLDEYARIPNIWLGVINAIVAPELHPKNGWKIIEKFTNT